MSRQIQVSDELNAELQKFCHSQNLLEEVVVMEAIKNFIHQYQFKAEAIHRSVKKADQVNAQFTSHREMKQQADAKWQASHSQN